MKQFVGMKYTFSKCSKPGYPFWTTNKLPDFEYIYKKGSVCVGLTNLVRTYMKKEIPGNITGHKISDFIGGTEEWFTYLKKKKRLEKICLTKVYPKGTLLLQNYNSKDYGHVVVTINSSKKGLLESKIIHAIHGTYKTKKYNSTVIELLQDYPNYERFTHICLPQNWLLKN